MKPKIPKIFWVIIFIALLLNLFTVVVALKSAGNRSYPKSLSTVEPIDYGKLSTTIHNEVTNQVAQLPQPATVNGINGTNGVNGKDGKDGSPGAEGVKGEPGKDGAQGEQGPPGADAKAVELRYNTSKSQVEWRYEGDFTWKVLVTQCVLNNTCLPL